MSRQLTLASHSSVFALAALALLAPAQMEASTPEKRQGTTIEIAAPQLDAQSLSDRAPVPTDRY